MPKANWKTLYVGGEFPHTPSFIYTASFCVIDHPDIIAFSIPQTHALDFMWSFHSHITAGNQLQTGVLYEDFSNLPCMFLPVREAAMRERLTRAVAICENAGATPAALQMVWPDRAGIFPWQDGYDQGMLDKQPILSDFIPAAI